ncbi:hypothetical protein EC991_001011 [Linnemannia zychae]|nr:hypothetical protein EC991_001011 [Linnemannia zychae]
MHEQFYQDLGQQEVEHAVDGANNQYQDMPVVPRCQEPLYNLKKLVAWGMEHMTVSEIISVFDHCPNIDRLKVPSVSFGITSPELDKLARSISDRCPRLRTLAVLEDLDGPLLARLMDVMPTNQLEAVKINTFEYLGIDLETTRHLVSDPYYINRGPQSFVLDAQEQEVFNKLEKFYRQIGGLVELEDLDLRAVKYNPKYDRVDEQGQELVLDNQSVDEQSHTNAFPGLLSLPSSSSPTSTNWPGYLDLLSGWTKLKTFRGSIRLDVGPNVVAVGEKEIEWFVEHWPALERVAFFRDEKKRKTGKASPAGLLRLREARPSLMLWD